MVDDEVCLAVQSRSLRNRDQKRCIAKESEKAGCGGQRYLVSNGLRFQWKSICKFRNNTVAFIFCGKPLWALRGNLFCRFRACFAALDGLIKEGGRSVEGRFKSFQPVVYGTSRLLSENKTA